MIGDEDFEALFWAGEALTGEARDDPDLDPGLDRDPDLARAPPSSPPRSTPDPTELPPVLVPRRRLRLKVNIQTLMK